MSWSFTVTGTDKEKLKDRCRKELTQYQTDGPVKEMMGKVADAHATLIDLHAVRPGYAIRVESNGHLDTSTGSSHNVKVAITNTEPFVG